MTSMMTITISKMTSMIDQVCQSSSWRSGLGAWRSCWKGGSRLSRRLAGSLMVVVVVMMVMVTMMKTSVLLVMAIFQCTMSRYQTMRGKMDSLVRVLDELKQTVGLALGPNVAHQMARAAQTVKDIAYA